MKKFSIFILVLVLCVAIVGLYRGWFVFSSGRQPESNKVDVSLTMDPDKVKEDANAVKEKAGELTDKTFERDEPDQKDQ
jgi:hypothetical protein